MLIATTMCSADSMEVLEEQLARIPLGYTRVKYAGRRYGLARTDFNAGRGSKVFAEELGGNDFISFNVYRTRKGLQLKPCEMPEEKVLDFLAHFAWPD